MQIHLKKGVNSFEPSTYFVAFHQTQTPKLLRDDVKNNLFMIIYTYTSQVQKCSKNHLSSNLHNQNLDLLTQVFTFIA